MFWIKTKSTIEGTFEDKRRIIYVLPKRSIFDLAVLRSECRKNKFPYPKNHLLSDTASYLYITKPGILRAQKHQESRLLHLHQLIEETRRNPDSDIHIVPASIFWGRDPGREERSFFKLLFSDEENAGWLQKLFIVFAHGRNNFIHFGHSVSLRDFCSEEISEDQLSRKLFRILRVHFIKQRSVYLGSKLYNREQIIRRIARSPAVREAILEESKKKNKSFLLSQERKARKYAREIAADTTYPVVRMFEILLTRLWKRLFAKVFVSNIERVKRLSESAEIVFVPNHRSHVDYLLISYHLYAHGLPNPHTAAGINLNFWPVGTLLRKGGGFFLRRRLGGNRLYVSVFNEYIHTLITHGHPIAFFPEGGRSRIGTLLEPKTGMLSMIVQSFVRMPTRPLVFVPVYIGYDKVIEVISYLKELAGSRKKNESIGQLLKARKILSENYGNAYLNFGEPVFLEPYLTENWSNWIEHVGSLRQEFPAEMVVDLGERFLREINKAAVVSPVSLVSLILLSTSKMAMGEADVSKLGNILLQIARSKLYSDRIVIHFDDLSTQLNDVQRLGVFERLTSDEGDILFLNEMQRNINPYYKNNILHLFALPSIICRFFLENDHISVHDLQVGVKILYPFFRDELYLPWTIEDLPQAVMQHLKLMCDTGLLVMSDDQQVVTSIHSAESRIMARFLGFSIDKYAIMIFALARAEGGRMGKRAFEEKCQKLAQKIALLAGLTEDEASRIFVFKNCAAMLRRLRYVQTTTDEYIVGEGIANNAKPFEILLRDRLRET
ncbi:MAG: glycerol-3-phosphate 1-O-acyltransferase PlsB [Oligoflexales bacterium]